MAWRSRVEHICAGGTIEMQCIMRMCTSYCVRTLFNLQSCCKCGRVASCMYGLTELWYMKFGFRVGLNKVLILYMYIGFWIVLEP